jgi:DNA (cytosine-5)-methyltransferase 1
MLMPISSSDATAIDFYCGIGGTTSGFVRAGVRVRLAANHSEVAIATHSANHPGVDHYLGDIQALDLRRLPRARILCASPICTEVSPAGGKKKRTAQMELWEQAGHVETASFERTRVTFWEVIRAAEIWRYDLVIIENVVEAAAWELFDIWLDGMAKLGYEAEFCSVSAAHIGDDEDPDGDNPRAPQWRDRLYIGLRRKGIRPLGLDPRPLAYCFHCGQDVLARQWWKPKKGQKTFQGRRIGKYGPQYLYVCPNPHRKHESPIVEPYASPVINAIDWTNPGTRIGDRKRPLGAPTMRRIEYGLRTIGDPALVAAGGNTWDAASGATASGNGKTKVPDTYLRAWPGATSPAPAQTSAQQNGIATSEPFITMLRNNGGSQPVTEPTMTIAGARHHGLTIPPGAFVMKQYGGRLRDEHAVKPVTEPIHATVGSSVPNLVIPYRKGSKAHRPDQPISTVATKAQHGILQTAVEIEDCYFRMLTPRESANTQRFDPDYILTGSLGEQQLGAGNANPVNVAQWIATKALAALDQVGAA